MDRLLFIDTETGGLNPRIHSLLTLGLVVWDKQEGILYKREICQKLNEYITTKEALEINHFDIKKYKETDILSASEINEEILMIKSKYFNNYSRIPLAGHNVQFDYSFMREMYNSAGLDYGSIFSHRLVDMFSILQYLIHRHIIPDYVNNSTKAFEYYGISIEGRHTALGDSLAAAELYTKLLNLSLDKI